MEDEKEGQVISRPEKAQNSGKLPLHTSALLLILITWPRNKQCCRCHQLSYAHTTAHTTLDADSSYCNNVQGLPEEKSLQLAPPEEALCGLLHAAVGDE